MLNPIDPMSSRKPVERKLCLAINLLMFWAQAQASAFVQTNVTAAAQTPQEVHLLEQGKTHTRELAGGQSHSYQITLDAGQYLNVVVEQHGIDVALTLLGPDDKQIADIDAEIRPRGQEAVSQVAEIAGNYRLNVRAKQKETPLGRYEVRVAELRAATEKDIALQEARKLNAEFLRLYRAGEYERARPPAERALEIREKTLDPGHSLIAASLNNLAVLHGSKGDYAKAEPLYQRALAIREKTLDPEHPDVATALNNIAELYRIIGDYAKAEPMYQRALAIREKSLGPDHSFVAATLNNLAILHGAKGDFARAELLWQRALAIQEKTLGPAHHELASTLSNLAGLYRTKGDGLKAEPLYQRALAMREKLLGPEHPNVASSLNNLAELHRERDEYAKAEPLLRRALAIREKMLGPNHPDVAASLSNLAILHHEKGDYAKAEPLHQRALAIRENSLGPEHPEVTISLNNYAELHRRKGDYAKAEPLLQRALAIKEKVLGSDHPDVATSLGNLAILHGEKGDYARAEPLQLRALAIREKAFGLEHHDVAFPLTSLAVLHAQKGEFARAEPLFQRALAIREKALGSEHHNVAESLGNLSNLYCDKGEFARAEPLQLRALAIREKTLGPEHPDVATSLGNLANLYRDKGDYAKAAPLYQRALAIDEKALGLEHPKVALSLNNLARLYAAKNELNQAVALQSRASVVSERNLALNLATGSERQKIAYLALLSAQTDEIVSLHVHAAAADPASRDLAITTILRRKGRVLDAMTDSFAALRGRSNPEDQELLDQLRSALSQLAQLVLNGPRRITPAEHQSRIKSLEEEAEKLQARISQRSDEFRAQSQPITLAAIQASIPPEAALVEFFIYRPRNAKSTKKEEEFGAPRYVAYILRKQEVPQWVGLGEAKAIDEAIDAWRRSLRDPKRRDASRLARAVDRLVMQPIRTHLGATRRVLLSPDGMLNLIPFAALVDERSRFLVERYEFSYLTSGRDLPRLQVKQPSRQPALIVANPNYGEAAKEGSNPTGANLGGLSFRPLAATADEARTLKKMMPAAVMMLGDQATETTVKQTQGPDLLHVATHGFFLPDLAPLANVRRRGMDGEILPGDLPAKNPLLLSGLALAGANQRHGGHNPEDDGVLTALEATALDLWGTKLVVLSACDTGLGEVKNGEGVYGLRRALVLAGSESQVMSLWPVSDEATLGLMAGYYQGLQQGHGRSTALRQVQLRMLRSRDRRHPFYWAGFIQSGEWANLQGKR
jgi:CHAT domain-containing protein/Tfp pilus assembly protein PilF